MLSAPPPIAIWASPSMMLCAADTMACSPEPHRRLTLKAGVLCDKPAFKVASHAPSDRNSEAVQYQYQNHHRHYEG